MQMLRLASRLGFVALLLLLPACGGDDRPETYPAKGQLFIKGQAYAGVTLLFYPQGQTAGNVPLPRATTDAQGNFEVTTFEAGDGAPKGKYKVTAVYEIAPVTFGKKAKKPPKYDAKYQAAERTPFEVTIEPKEGNVIPTLNVK